MPPVPSSGPVLVGSPPVVTLTPTEAEVTANDRVGSFEFVADVRDPDGQGDIADVFLTNASGTITYGAMTRRNEFTWVAGVAGSDANSLEPINLPSGGGNVTFGAYALDRSSNRGSAQAQVLVRCSNAPRAVCQGRCVDLQTNYDHCGACDRPVPAGSGMQCIQGAFSCGSYLPNQCGGTCVDLQDDAEHCGNCSRSCPAQAGAAGLPNGMCRAGVCASVTRATGANTCRATCAQAGWFCTGGSVGYTRGRSLIVGCDALGPQRQPEYPDGVREYLDCDCAQQPAPPETLPTGSACTNAADCPRPGYVNWYSSAYGATTSCATGSNNPGGMCISSKCLVDAECGAQGRCVDLSGYSDVQASCMLDCSAGCRPGYQCVTANNLSGGTSRVCMGGCAQNTRCPDGRFCVAGACPQ